jgi:protein-L-isoaspartate(D-aspartate) O-methyltransferase
MAYDDGPLPIGKGQTISQPYIVALMTELLELNGDERILEIGTGSGYQAAVLSPLVKKVYSIEIVKSLADRAGGKLKELQYHNVSVKWGDGYQGWIEHAPYDAIIVTAAPDRVPQTLLDQMKIGGRLVLPVGTFYQKLKVITKMGDGEVGEKNIISVRFVPMVHSEKTPRDSSKFQISD